MYKWTSHIVLACHISVRFHIKIKTNKCATVAHSHTDWWCSDVVKLIMICNCVSEMQLCFCMLIVCSESLFLSLTKKSQYMNSGSVRCITRTLSVVLASESAKKSQGYDALTVQNVKWYIMISIFCCNETFYVAYDLY